MFWIQSVMLMLTRFYLHNAQSWMNIHACLRENSCGSWENLKEIYGQNLNIPHYAEYRISSNTGQKAITNHNSYYCCSQLVLCPYFNHPSYERPDGLMVYAINLLSLKCNNTSKYETLHIIPTDHITNSNSTSFQFPIILNNQFID